MVAMQPADVTPRGPLEGIRVIETGTMIAGPFCGHLSADCGVEVSRLPGATKSTPAIRRTTSACTGPAGLTSQDGLARNSGTLGELRQCQAAHLPPARDLVHHSSLGERPVDCFGRIRRRRSGQKHVWCNLQRGRQLLNLACAREPVPFKSKQDVK